MIPRALDRLSAEDHLRKLVLASEVPNTHAMSVISLGGLEMPVRLRTLAEAVDAGEA
ncbi:MAG: hypothetical protein ACJ78H_04770 [Chloroflexota bacterium]